MEEWKLLASAAIFSIWDNIKSTEETNLKKKIDADRKRWAAWGSDSDTEKDKSEVKSINSSMLELKNEIPDIQQLGKDVIASHINMELMTNAVIRTKQKSKIVPSDPIKLEDEIIGQVPRYMTHTSSKLLWESDYTEINMFKEMKSAQK